MTNKKLTHVEDKNMKRLCGVNPPVITIFDKDKKIDFAALKKHADFLIEKGVDGLAYLGTSGEFSIMNMEEKKMLIKEMTAYVDHRVNVLIGVGDTCLEHTLELVKVSEEAGANGVLLVNPYFSVYSSDMVEAYYGYVASQTTLPIIIYNFPDLTGFGFDVEMVARLAETYPNIVGIKDTTADFSHVVSMLSIKKLKPEFSVFAAYENQAMGLLPLGIDGFINATVNFAPEFTVNAFQAAKENDFNEAAKWFGKMVDAMEIYSFSTPLFLACKQAVYDRVLKQDGFERLPALPLKEGAKYGIYEKLEEMGLLPNL